MRFGDVLKRIISDNFSKLPKVYVIGNISEILLWEIITTIRKNKLKEVEVKFLEDKKDDFLERSMNLGFWEKKKIVAVNLEKIQRFSIPQNFPGVFILWTETKPVPDFAYKIGKENGSFFWVVDDVDATFSVVKNVLKIGGIGNIDSSAENEIKKIIGEGKPKNILKEIEKLINYVYPARFITKEDIENCFSPEILPNIKNKIVEAIVHFRVFPLPEENIPILINVVLKLERILSRWENGIPSEKSIMSEFKSGNAEDIMRFLKTKKRGDILLPLLNTIRLSRTGKIPPSKIFEVFLISLHLGNFDSFS